MFKSPLLGEGLGVRLFSDRQLLLLFHFDSYGKYLCDDQAEHAKHKCISPCANPFITFNDTI